MMCARKAGLSWALLGVLTIALGSATNSLAKESISGKGITKNLDLLMQAQVGKYAFSGSVLVVQSGHVLLSKGYGKASIEWDRPNTSVTKFRIGSLTKQFTATALLQLREKGSLQLTDSVCKYLQPCPSAWNSITLHHLLSHTSGIPGYPSTIKDQETTPAPWSPEKIETIYRDVPLEFAPGSQAKYSDWGYYVLGVVIEQVTKKEYEDILREQIFAPLGMMDTGYDRTATVLEHRASGYRLDGKRIQNADYIDMAGPFSAGALYSTVEDLYRWDQALYGDAVLPETARQDMWRPVLSNYAYGWWVNEPEPSAANPQAWWALPGRLQICHSGGINGFVSEFLRFPNERLTVIVLANTEVQTVIGPFLAAMVLGNEFHLPQ